MVWNMQATVKSSTQESEEPSSEIFVSEKKCTSWQEKQKILDEKKLTNMCLWDLAPLSGMGENVHG